MFKCFIQSATSQRLVDSQRTLNMTQSTAALKVQSTHLRPTTTKLQSQLQFTFHFLTQKHLSMLTISFKTTKDKLIIMSIFFPPKIIQLNNLENVLNLSGL